MTETNKAKEERNRKWIKSHSLQTNHKHHHLIATFKFLGQCIKSIYIYVRNLQFPIM